MLRISVRNRRAARLAVVAFGGCLALAACGPVQLGAAAIVGGQRITTTALTNQVANLDNAYQAGHGITLAFPKSQMPQEVLGWLIRFQVREQLRTREGITITNGDIQRAVSAVAAQASQSGGAGLRTLAVENGLPPDLIATGLGRYLAIQNAFLARLDGGVTPTSAAQQQALSQQFNHAQCLAAKSLSIRINPQYGRLDYSQLGIVAAANTLSAPEVGASPVAASPSARPEYSPPC